MKSVAFWADQTHYLMVQLNHLKLGTSYFMDTQLIVIPIAANSNRSGSNYPSSCMRVIFKPLWKYSLLIWLIHSSMFFIYQFLIILPVANRICQYMVLRNPMPSIFIRWQHGVTSLYLSRTPLRNFGTTTWRTIFLVDVAFWVHTFFYHSRIFLEDWDIWRMLLLIACSILFASCLMMCWNCLALSALLISQVVYYFLFSSNCEIGKCESFTMICVLLCFLSRRFISW